MNVTVADWLASLADWEATPEAVAAGRRIADLMALDRRVGERGA